MGRNREQSGGTSFQVYLWRLLLDGVASLRAQIPSMSASSRPRLADRVLPKAMIDYSNGYDLKNEDGAVKHTA